MIHTITALAITAPLALGSFTPHADAASLKAQLVQAKKTIAKQRSTINKQKTVIRALRTKACPIPSGTLQAVAMMNADQVWSLLPIIYGTLKSAEAAAMNDESHFNTPYSASKTYSVYTNFTHESFSFDHYE